MKCGHTMHIDCFIEMGNQNQLTTFTSEKTYFSVHLMSQTVVIDLSIPYWSFVITLTCFGFIIQVSLSHLLQVSN